MALSLVNYFIIGVEEARVPLMLIDFLVIMALGRWEDRLKKEKALLVAKGDKEHEQEKLATTTSKDENHVQRLKEKAAQKAQKHAKNGKQSSFSPKHHIQQPDKSKKS